MIDSAVLKLTGWYLAMIMALSLGFSLFLYNLYDAEFTRGLRRQDIFFNSMMPQGLPGFNEFREAQIVEGEQRLKSNLALFNLIVFVAGGAASYALARRTLKPIGDAFEAQGRFVADASHELRTPLTAIQTEIEVTLRNGNLTQAEAEALLRSNLEEVAKLKSLSDGLLKLARGATDHSHWTKFSLKQITDQAIKTVLPLAAAKTIELIDQASDHRLYGDQTNLTELLVILLDNAIKYSPAESRIRLTTRKVGSFVSLAVIDQGQGISASDLPHIFDRFYRTDASRARNQAGGYGLGLAIAKTIAENHGGELSAKSSSGRGSTFIVRLPIA